MIIEKRRCTNAENTNTGKLSPLPIVQTCNMSWTAATTAKQSKTKANNNSVVGEVVVCNAELDDRSRQQQPMNETMHA